MTRQQAPERSIKTKAINEFLEKVHSAMTDLVFDVDNINEDTMHDWNRVLKKLTDEILAFEPSSNRKDLPPGQRSEGGKNE